MGRNQIIAAVVGLAVAVGAAFFGYGAWQKKKLQSRVVTYVTDAGAQLDARLGMDINAPSGPEALPALEKSIQDTGAALDQLRAENARSERALVDAADDYVALALNVMKRQAGSLRGRQKFAESHKVLTAHLSHAGQRSTQWMNEAIKLRQQLDRDYFEYNTAASSLANMLLDYPKSRKKITSLLPASALPADAAATEAHRRAVASAEKTKQEYERAKQLIAPG